MPWLTPAVFRQGPSETIFDIPTCPGFAPSPSFAHILNTYTDRICPSNNKVQDLTFAAIQAARAFVNVDVRCIGVPSFDDKSILPPDIVIAPSVTRSVLDVREFRVPRSLPLLFDVLELGIGKLRDLRLDQENAFVVFTNSDIHPMPHFYSTLARLIQMGYDTIIVNRRTIPDHAIEVVDLPLMYSELGIDHPGYDCFVFPVENWSSFVRTDACIGAGWVMRSLLYNLAATAKRMLMLTHVHATFHIGDERIWQNPDFKDYVDFNLDQANGLIVKLIDRPDFRRKLLPFCEANGEPEVILAQFRLK